MAETDVLNPVQGFWQTLGDNPTWNYDWTRKKAINKTDIAARLGAPYSRDVGNAGYSFAWNWINRPYATMERLVSFYDNFKHGYFTVVDWDGGGRHYVGRFIAPPYPQQVGHTMWSAQAVQFQEQPRARMLEYPSNFAIDGHPIYVLDDYLNPRVAAMQGTWTPTLSPLAPGSVNIYVGGVPYVVGPTGMPQWQELVNTTPAASDWAQVEYTGWGFLMIFRLDPSFGICTVELDGVPIMTALDLTSGAATDWATGAPPVVGAPSSDYPDGNVTVSVTNIPLDSHRVKVVCAGGGGPVIFPTLEYIY